MIRGIRVIRSPNLFYISGPEKVRNRVENQLFVTFVSVLLSVICKVAVLKMLTKVREGRY